MRRRDRLTYDLGSERQQTASGPSPAMIALLAAVIAIAVLLVIWAFRSSSGPESGGPEPAQSGPVSTATPLSSPSPSQLAAGSDAELIDQALEGSTEAADAFVLAWLEPDPKERETALAEVAAPGLAEQLMLTSSDNIPDTDPAGDPVLAEASTYSTEFEQALEDGTKIRIYLVSDPEADHGWLATSVEEA